MSSAAGASKACADLGRLVAVMKLSGQVAEDVVQLGQDSPGGVVFAAGHVETAMSVSSSIPPPATAQPPCCHKPKLPRHVRARSRRTGAIHSPPTAVPKADGVSANPRFHGLLAASSGMAPALLAVGQQDDDVGRVRQPRQVSLAGRRCYAGWAGRWRRPRRWRRWTWIAADGGAPPTEQALDRRATPPCRRWAGAPSAKPAKATMPENLRAGRLAVDEFARRPWPACNRLEAISVEHMPRETSIARMIDVWLVGTYPPPQAPAPGSG